jgi:hypothetical protein
MTLDALLQETEQATWPEMLPRHLSPSSLKMYMRCREQYRRRYVLGEKERPGAALVWGNAHNFALVETNFAQKIETGTDMSVADVELAFAEGFDQSVEKDGGEAEVQWGDNKPGELKDKGVLLASHYHKTVSPTVTPIAVERSFAAGARRRGPDRRTHRRRRGAPHDRPQDRGEAGDEARQRVPGAHLPARAAGAGGVPSGDEDEAACDLHTG